jgi:hypothetical protein
MELTEPHICRQRAEEHATAGDHDAAQTWALLAILGELAERRRLERKRQR